MNTTLLLALLAISFVGLLLFWLFYQRSNSTQKLSQNYLIAQLKNQELSEEQRKIYEQQLSKILQQDNKQQGTLKIFMLVALAIPLSFVLYNKLGNPKAVDYIKQDKQNDAQQGQAPQMSMQEAIAQLEARLQQNPEDVDGQMLYARSQISLKNYEKAVAAYRKSNELVPNESVILTELAEAIALNNNQRSFLGEPEELLAKAVELEPNNQKALWLYGMTFYEHKNLEKTNEIWSKLYEVMSDADAKKQLAEQLNGIRQQLGLNKLSDDKPAQIMAVNEKANLSIKINLSEEIKNQLSDDKNNGLLYVYSKEQGGMPMPIAVVKQSISNIKQSFPVEIKMSDANSLNANRKLSDFDIIVVGARISYSGNAMPQEGDLQAKEYIISLPYEGTFELQINSVR